MQWLILTKASIVRLVWLQTIKYLVTLHGGDHEHARVCKSDVWLKSRNEWMLQTLNGSVCQRLMSQAFWMQCEKLKVWSGWLWWSSFLLILSARGGTDTCLPFVCSSTTKKSKSSRTCDARNRARTCRCAVKYWSAGGSRPACIGRRAPAHLTAWFSCVTCMCVTCIRLCGSFQLAWMCPSVCCVEEGTVPLDVWRIGFTAKNPSLPSLHCVYSPSSPIGSTLDVLTCTFSIFTVG